jgi:hypothetical protein
VDDTAARRFFLEPTSSPQRQYEALRAVFVEGCSQKAAALRFHYSPGAFRLLVQQFRAALADGVPPPFSPGLASAGRLPTQPETNPLSRTSRRSPTPDS